jgi:hypothetical protein
MEKEELELKTETEPPVFNPFGSLFNEKKMAIAIYAILSFLIIFCAVNIFILPPQL